MNDNRLTYHWLLLLPVIALFSCSQEDIPGLARNPDYDGICFHASMPAGGTRSAGTTETGTLNEGFQVSAICPEDDEDPTKEYFSNLTATPLDEAGKWFGIYKNDADDRPTEQCLWPTTRHGKQGRLKFFAFYPSLDKLKECAGVETEEEAFQLENKTDKSGDEINYDYRINNFKVNKDIARHVDFVTATAEGSRKANEASGVKLEFEHQLSRIKLQVWGNLDDTEIKDIEIAGVRIGRAVTESDFNFAARPAGAAQGDNTLNGDWVKESAKKGCVEYIFAPGE